MDVAVFHHLPPGGGAPRVLAEYLRRARHDFTVYTRMPEAAGLLDVEAGVRVRRFPLPEPANAIERMRELWQLPRRGRELAGIMDEGGHDVAFCFASTFVQSPEVLPYLRMPSLYYAPETLRILLEPEEEFARLETLRARMTRRGLNPYENKRIRLNDRNIRGADLVVTHSHHTARQLRELHGVAPEVVELGVDSDAFTPADVPREPFVLAVGALHPLKGHHFVVEALATLPRDARPPLVVVCDRGGDAGPLVQLAHTLGVDMQLRRMVPFDDLVDLYRRAGVLACGQVREPFGLTPLEAMATRTPVVAVAEGGFLETVRDGKTGVLAPREPAAFAAAVAHVLADRELASRLGAAGRETVVREWTWERTIAGYDALLERLARGR